MQVIMRLHYSEEQIKRGKSRQMKYLPRKQDTKETNILETFINVNLPNHGSITPRALDII